jgi:hypothetical protein
MNKWRAIIIYLSNWSPSNRFTVHVYITAALCSTFYFLFQEKVINGIYDVYEYVQWPEYLFFIFLLKMVEMCIIVVNFSVMIHF